MNSSILLYKDKYKIIEAFVYTFLYLLFFKLIVIQIPGGPDYKIHLGIIDKYMNGNFYIPHPGFHLSVYWLSKITSFSYESITPFFIAFVIILTIKLTHKVIAQIVPGLNPFLYLFFSAAINIAIALYIPFFNREMYVGQWSPNIWHSPTMTVLKPFAVLGFFWIIDLFKNQYAFKTVEVPILASLSLLIGTFVKPSFIICFIPAIAIYLFLFRKKQYGLYLKILYVLLPSILLLIYQYIETYSLNLTDSYFHDNIKLTWFGVTKMYTKSVIISSFLVLAFPLSILLVSYRRISQNIYLQFSWILFIVSFLIAGLLAEQYKFNQGAFIFSYIICLFILYVVSICEYLNWLNDIRNNKFKIAIIGAIFSYHLFSGILYISHLLISPSI